MTRYSPTVMTAQFAPVQTVAPAAIGFREQAGTSARPRGWRLPACLQWLRTKPADTAKPAPASPTEAVRGDPLVVVARAEPSRQELDEQLRRILEKRVTAAREQAGYTMLAWIDEGD